MAILNIIALVEVLLAFGFAKGLDTIVGLGSGPLQGVVLYPVMAMLDLGYRFYRQDYRRWQDLSEDTEWLTDRRRGGSIFFVPVWAIGLILLILSLVMLLQGDGK